MSEFKKGYKKGNDECLAFALSCLKFAVSPLALTLTIACMKGSGLNHRNDNMLNMIGWLTLPGTLLLSSLTIPLGVGAAILATVSTPFWATFRGFTQKTPGKAPAPIHDNSSPITP